MKYMSIIKCSSVLALTIAVSACSSNPKQDESDFQPVVSQSKADITISNVLFDFEDSDLRREARGLVSKAASFLEANPGKTAAITGHTDSVGESDYNVWLSDLRAESVKKSLMNQGISASRITTRGFGEARPVADNGTAAGRQDNRRVEINFK